MKITPILLIMFLVPNHLVALSWGDVWGGVKSAANTVGDGAKKAVNEVAKIKNCFGDTKVTRSVDYGVRKGAFETALLAATGALSAAKAISTGSLDAAEASAKLGVSAAQEFLKGVEGVSVGAMQASAEASKGILEGVKQGTVGVLKGTRFVVGHVMDQFDINEIMYKGDLQRLAGGVLGDVRVRGKFFVDFNEELTLDPKNIPNSIARLVEKLVSKLGSAVFAPIMSEVRKADTKLQDPKVVTGLIVLTQPEPAAVTAGVESQKKIEGQLAVVDAKVAEMQAILQKAEADLKKLAALPPDQLLELVVKAVPKGGSYDEFTLRARQELAQRAKIARRGGQ